MLANIELPVEVEESLARGAVHLGRADEVLGRRRQGALFDRHQVEHVELAAGVGQQAGDCTPDASPRARDQGDTATERPRVSCGFVSVNVVQRVWR